MEIEDEQIYLRPVGSIEYPNAHYWMHQIAQASDTLKVGHSVEEAYGIDGSSHYS